MTVELFSYAPQRMQVTVSAGQTTVLNLVLRPQAVELDELRIRAGQPRAEALERARTDPSVVAVQFARALDFNTESYARIEENDFRLVSASPLSTFSIDVDRASYANIRRFIQAGDRPPIDAVRIEEMINYFPYDWGNVTGDHPFSVTTEVWEAPWKRDHRLVRIGLHAESIDTADLPPGNLVFLLDVSGSMTPPDKLPLLKKALGLLVDQLRPDDRVAVVVYAGAAGLVLPSTPGDRKGRYSGGTGRPAGRRQHCGRGRAEAGLRRGAQAPHRRWQQQGDSGDGRRLQRRRVERRRDGAPDRDGA